MKKPTPSQPLEPSEEPEIQENDEAMTEEELRQWAHEHQEHMARRVARIGMRERRVQRQKLIAELVTRHKAIRNQTELQQLLEGRGMLATQSSISRDLRDLGVRRVKGVYVLKPSREAGWSFDDVIELVEMVTRAGPYTTILQTVPDAARLVARTLEETGWDEVAGTVADEKTIFVATRSEEEQDRLFDRFKKYLSV
jgi:transcriptional regulator of arginine metabolism